MRSIFILLFFTLFMVVMDLYAFRGLQQLFVFPSGGNRFFTLFFWSITAVMVVVILWAGSLFRHMRDPSRFFSLMLVMGIFMMNYIPKLLFNVSQLAGDIIVLAARLFNGKGENLRSNLLLAGTIGSTLVFIAFGLGMLRGRTNVKVFREEIGIESLPAAFNGLRIVQISDLHLAGFYNQPGHIRKVVEMVNMLEPDLLLFTGDMVNNFSEEVDPFVDILQKLQASLGKYAVLGNHDYGKYFNWDSPEEEEANLQSVKDQIRSTGFDLLLNENRTIAYQGDSLDLIGVENWGKPPFPQLGDLSKAMEGTDPGHVKILMSHDPSHWDLKVRGKEAIQLTLSGHTHGMQLGIEIGRFKWSPSKWIYKNWGGRYEENGQVLYVNRGLGFTGFPGRIGIRPEITLITLASRL